MIDRDLERIGRAARLRKNTQAALLDVDRARPVVPPIPGVFVAGDVVVFRARWIASVCSGLDPGREFTVQECSCPLCERGGHVCTDQWLPDYECFRHLARANVRHRGTLETDDVPVGVGLRISIPRIPPTVAP